MSLASVVVAVPAGAVLKHYALSWTTISEFNTSNPNPVPPSYRVRLFLGSPYHGPWVWAHPQVKSRGIVDDQSGGFPVLRKLILSNDYQQTSCCYGFDRYLFLSRHVEEGPRKGLDFTGDGNTSTTIAWGLVTGWTITGGTWCNSDWPYLCTFAVGGVLTTIDPPLHSPFYDLGTWVFHGTGFTSVPFVHQKSPATNMTVGNWQYPLRGRLAAGLVPAVPVLGVAVLGAGLLVAGARLARRE
jgi:hypothetical protein